MITVELFGKQNRGQQNPRPVPMMKPTALNPVLPGAETAARGVPDDVVLRVQRQLLGGLEGEAALAAAVLVRVPLRHQRAAQQRRRRGR